MSTFITVQGRGTISLPAAARKRYHLDEPGAQVEVIEEGDYIVLRPTLPVSATQAWYWTQDNLAGERQADSERSAGLGETFDSNESFLDSFTD
jgi:bifunctional DNA-binding transcriptional regulator/antitoxin component of YhaV-PrlF toxin-antitoxin module